MDKFIFNYLSEYFYISTSDMGNDGVYEIKDEREHKPPYHSNKLKNDLVTIFGVEPEEVKLLVQVWGAKQKDDLDLEFYWKTMDDILVGFYSGNFESIELPLVRRVFAQTLSTDLVSVQAMSAPTCNLFYIDYQYKEKRWYEKINEVIKFYIKKIRKLIIKFIPL